MKTNFIKNTTVILIAIVMVAGITIPINAQTFTYTIQNCVQTSDKTLEFDLYLHNKDSKRPIEVAGIQAGVTINPAIINGGSITVSLVPESSELAVEEQPTSITFASNCIKVATRPGPGTGNGTIMSTATQGTRYCRIKVTNSVAFAIKNPNLTFSFTTIPYPTKIHEYVDGISTPLKIDTTNCYSKVKNYTMQDYATIAAKTSTNTSIEINIIKNKVYLTGLEGLASVSVYDVAGKEVQSFTDVSNNQALLLHDNGIFIIKATTATQTLEHKVLSRK